MIRALSQPTSPSCFKPRSSPLPAGLMDYLLAEFFKKRRKRSQKESVNLCPCPVRDAGSGPVRTEGRDDRSAKSDCFRNNLSFGCLSSQTELEILQNPEHYEHRKQRLMKRPCQKNPKISEGSCGAGTEIISTQPMHAKSEVLREVRTHISSDTVCY